MKILFIVNPAAGKGKAKEITPRIEKLCKDYNVKYEIKYTTKPHEATIIAKSGIEACYERIVAVGGDGTLNEVVNGIAGSDVALGIIPAGSGNDFIKSITSSKNIDEIILNSIHGEIRQVDLAKCNDRYFINVGSVGFDAEVAARASVTKKLLTGIFAYLAAAISILFTFKGMNIKTEIDGQLIEKRALLIAIANAKYYGGGILPAPKADIEDGFFDICFVEHVPKLRILYLLPKYIKGQHENIKEVHFYKSKKVKFISNKEISINVDGEIFMDKQVTFEIIPKSIKVIFPCKE
jgi:diacylglycerol kinase (ATP)